MIKTESDKCNENVCNLKYLAETMGGKKHLIKEIMDVFLKQIPEEMQSINEAIIKMDFVTIKNFAHTMKSSVSIMGISLLAPILQEMENLSGSSVGIEKIIKLNQQLVLICRQAIKEIESEKERYASHL